MPMRPEASADLLDIAYDRLGYADVDGEGFLAASQKAAEFPEETWIEKGDWLALAKYVGAERIFFLENNPVVVFARSGTGDQHFLRQLYHGAWSMSRPRLLFLAKPGELAVYDLARRPLDPHQDFTKLESLEVARSAAEVEERLKCFRREEIETGHIFEAEKRFGKNLNGRADKALIHDLKAVRRELMAEGLRGRKLKYAHALIGRSIFIRYLEDRGVLTEEYFRKVARGRQEWRAMLEESPPLGLCLEESQGKPLYPRVLRDHAFTYAMFRRLAADFNGDMFPGVDEEAQVVKQPHLNLVRDLMYGEVGRQKRLFFYAYRFSIIPIELISSIYEEFYHEESGEGRAYGAFYTPPALVEFVLSQTLTLERLASAPRIMDAACGSGIFLVEAFRRIVRYRVARQRRRLRFDELQKILRDQLAGIDINPEAIRVAAFSLYLAMLHYLDPPDILEHVRRGNRLPRLVATDDNSSSFNCLVSANAFDTKFLASRPALNERFSSDCADIIVGNPPWGSPGPQDEKARAQNQLAMAWCKERGLDVGDRERSQAFIWRTLDLLKPEGTAGLLVSTGVFFKHAPKSVSFRRQWLRGCRLDSVFSFPHARQVFFGSTIAPFAGLVFRKNGDTEDRCFVQYWSAKHRKTVEGLQAVVFSANDLHVISPEQDLGDHRMWKTLWWGSHRDLQLLSYLRGFPQLASHTARGAKGQGFKKANQKKDAGWLRQYKKLPIEHFHRYGPMDWDVLTNVPGKVECRGVQEVYDGMRLLVGRGIDESGEPKGQIIARLEDRPFAFTHAIHGVKLPGLGGREYRIVLGILWSSLGRYFFFLTTADWGIWHHAIGLDDELLTLPICFPNGGPLGARIVRIVDELREHTPQDRASLGARKTMTSARRRKLETKLDEAIFKLYGLKEEDVDLVRDLCDTGLDFFYRRDESEAVKPVLARTPDPSSGYAASLPDGPFGQYLRTFIRAWSAYLGTNEELRWEVHMPPETDSMLAVVLTLNDQGDPPKREPLEEGEWDVVLRRLDSALTHPISSRIYVEGLARAVTDDSIIVIKRNERRLWTKSMAREDAEATLVQAMNRDSLIGERGA